MNKYFILLFLLVGCGGHLVKDPSASAFESNYPTAEFKACGEVHHGSAVCMLEEGKQPQFEIQGYYKGVVKISSPDCTIDGTDTFRYGESQLVPVKLKDTDKSCFIQFVITPEYPKQERGTIDVYSFKGVLHFRRVPVGSEKLSGIAKVRQFLDHDLSFNIGGEDGQARLVFRGCDSRFDSPVDVDGGNVQVRLQELISTKEVRSCVLNGALIYEGRKIRITYLVSIYGETFQALPIPNVVFKKKKIKVEFDPTVSVIALNEKYKLKRKYSFKFRRDSFNILRGITVKGRSVIGIWNQQNQKFQWIQ